MTDVPSMSSSKTHHHEAIVSPPGAARNKFRFGLFELDGGTGELKKSGRVIPLRPQPAKVLAYLVAQPGELVLRQNLRRHIWGDTFIDAEAGLNACIRDIRAALGDRASAPTYIETVPRRGYRFIAPVEAPPVPTQAALPNAPDEPSSGIEASRDVGWARGRYWLLAAALIVGAIALAWIDGASYRQLHSSVEPQVSGQVVPVDASTASNRLPDVAPAAHEAILEARFLLDRGERGDVDAAVERARRATELAPSSGEAFLVLGDALFKVQGPPHDLKPAARNAYHQALNSDPALADAHLGLAAVSALYDWDLDAAFRELELAQQLGGETSDLHQSWAMFHLLAGRTDEALGHLRRALRLDPVSARIRGDIGWIYALTGDYQQAVEQCQRGLDLEPNTTWLHGCLVEAYRELGDLEAAAEAARGEMKAGAADRDALVQLDTDPESALVALDQWRLQRLLRARDDHYIPSCAIGIRYAQAGDSSQALRYLELAYEERSAFMPFLSIDRHLAPLHEDPRFRRLADRVAGEMRTPSESRS